MDPKAELRDLERDRTRPLRERDADGLERLAGDAAELSKSGARDRFIYTARQNAGPGETVDLFLGEEGGVYLIAGADATFSACRPPAGIHRNDHLEPLRS